MGKALYLLMYLGALAACMIPTYKKNIFQLPLPKPGRFRGRFGRHLCQYLVESDCRHGLVFIPVFVAGFILVDFILPFLIGSTNVVAEM